MIEMAENSPTLSLSEDMLEEIKEWKVGEEYKILLEVKQRSLEDPEYGNDKLIAHFEVLKASDATNKAMDSFDSGAY